MSLPVSYCFKLAIECLSIAAVPALNLSHKQEMHGLFFFSLAHIIESALIIAASLLPAFLFLLAILTQPLSTTLNTIGLLSTAPLA